MPGHMNCPGARKSNATGSEQATFKQVSSAWRCLPPCWRLPAIAPDYPICKEPPVLRNAGKLPLERPGKVRPAFAKRVALEAVIAYCLQASTRHCLAPRPDFANSSEEIGLTQALICKLTVEYLVPDLNGIVNAIAKRRIRHPDELFK